MPKEFTKEDVIQNKKDAIKQLNKFLETYINDPSERHLKKAHLLSYWIKDYIRLVNFEEKFEPTKNIAYKRGNIIKLNFGFNIGSEYGGLHYGIVLDNKNDHNSPILTVIPLTSLKEGKEVHPNSVDLGNEIYRLLKLKYDTISKTLREEQEDILKTLDMFNTFLSLSEDTLSEAEKYKNNMDLYQSKLISAETYFNTARKLQEQWQVKATHNKEEQEYLKKIGEEISRMKEGSIALVN